MPLNKTTFSCMSWWFSGYIKMMWVIEMWDQTLPMLFFYFQWCNSECPMFGPSIYPKSLCFLELFNLLVISCTYVFFIRKSLPLHDEKRKKKSYLWFCDRVMSCSQKYWGSTLEGCVFFSDEERQDWVRTVSKRRRNRIRINFMKE